MKAQHIILETDPSGNIKNIPKLPPNKKIEGIFLVLDDVADSSLPVRKPHPDLVGQVQILDDTFDSVPETDWEILQ
ncbi:MULTISPECIES: hypothetical protein [Cyanophyceae]|uniref:hypothetical protein n=1 Tax=Cyanophyceae TaxID=3028117 RepID=UPI00016DC692|nr:MULTISPECIES: hypothetical protein [Cyanophyceae]ACA98420.1 conserved hypothetical protein [Picosynechococcus sp. PCC 7002]SMH46703.1 hypothetical protein SAMN06272755_1699 [Picosynechococcus sp. OG1]SMQ80852.1 hypothetical protein SAMN06272774_0978 [Synechococcus sp. 7002]